MVDYREVFSCELGKSVFERARSTVERLGMRDMLKSGVLLGLSGGADSVLLLLFLLEYRRIVGDFKILAVHINHGIRGNEALRDERFSEALCHRLGVEFVAERIDVPTLAHAEGKGLEEVAREVRYSKFAEIIEGRNDISAIAVAHNATDNLETVIFNMLRGTGTRGLCGIPPIRDNIFRPLLEIPKAEICALLDECGVEYMIDSTNAQQDYSRNYIRNTVLPAIRGLCEDAEASVTRSSDNLRSDDDYISGVAEELLSTRESISADELSTLHSAVFFRVVSLMAARLHSSVEKKHLTAIRALLCKDNFSYDLPGGVSFVCERGVCSVRRRDESFEFDYPVSEGVNLFSDFDAELVVSTRQNPEISSNVYKISIQAKLSSVIIDGEMRLRSRRDGDTVFYGGHHHKLKKIMCDKKVPRSVRELIPVLCDDRGVVWVPGLPPRDDGVRDGEAVVRLGIGLSGEFSDHRFYSLGEFRS